MTQSQTTAASPLLALRDIVCHPLRIQSLIALTERKASVAELATDFGVDKGTVAYHVKKLLDAGAIEIVETRETRGPDENFYRAMQRPTLDEEATASLAMPERLQWLQRVLALMLADATVSLQSGVFAERVEHNLVRFPTSVDEQGFLELGQILADALQQAMDVEARSAGRMVENPASVAIPVRFATMLFEVPGGVDARQ